MFSFLKRERSNQEVVENVIGELKKIYRSKLLPLEEHYQFHNFHSPKLEDPDFDGKPMILLVGQYSTGKTTFIRYLLERDFPGIRIGDELTTDRFIAVMYDDKEDVIPGNALVVDPKRQFRPLSKYDNAFLYRSIKNLEQIYDSLQREHQISPGDFPDMKKKNARTPPTSRCCN